MSKEEKISILMELSDVVEFNSCHSVVAFVSKENVQLIYELFDAQPKNDDYELDDSYISGEIRFNFNKDTNEIEEVLLFPVYENDPEGIKGVDNGDFIRIDNMFSDSMIRRIWSFYAKNINAGKVQKENTFINVRRREVDVVYLTDLES